jgi:hypothetical protein
MPLSIVAELVVEFVVKPICELVVHIAGYVTATVLVPVISLGRAYVEPAAEGVRVTPRWHGFNRDSNGKIAIDCEMGAFLGLMFWGCVAVSCISYWRAGA